MTSPMSHLHLPSLYEHVYMIINQIQGSFHKTINMTENNNLFVFVCRKDKGQGGFNWIFNLFIIETDPFFNIMCGRGAWLDNLAFIKREKIQWFLNMLRFIIILHSSYGQAPPLPLHHKRIYPQCIVLCSLLFKRIYHIQGFLQYFFTFEVME